MSQDIKPTEKKPLSPEMLRRELHDGLCQDITAALFFAQNLKSRLQQNEKVDDVTLAQADRVVEAAAQAAEHMRAILKRLPPEK